ncbi:hypothetical protein SAMN05216206_2807 [Pseudomonas guineae]|uniref:Uncharacterized protein n=1 Tax=Pseudomonas guineae TaxID=425504 RepID=A0A1I3KFB4_9PSED|nr:hypothetical protein [Pseudomonas guineae]SFI71182.1 hypothetical protein SAMN05216206_2807 [Pseudomonas guineae]
MPTETKLTLKHQRAEQVNQAIKIIADHGRRFFYSQASGLYASVEVDARGKVWWIDDYTGKRIYTHPNTWGNRWRGFSHGGTLRDLVEAFRDYICTGKQLSPFYLGPERHRITDGNIWGYSTEAMTAVREQAGTLPVFRQSQQQDTA